MYIKTPKTNYKYIYRDIFFHLSIEKKFCKILKWMKNSPR